MRTLGESKVSMYPDWDLDFNEYWDIPNDSERQEHLLDFFRKCGLFDPEEVTELNLIALSKIQLDKVIAFPLDLGKRTIHEKKGFAKLRQCFLAEFLYKNGCAKEEITKRLVTHSTFEEKEVERWRILKRIGGKCVDFACIQTPVSRAAQRKNTKKKGGVIARISSRLMAPLSGRKRSINESTSEFDTHEPDIAIGNRNIPDNIQEPSHDSFISRISHKLTPFSFRKRPRLNNFATGRSDSAQSRETASTSSPTLHNEYPNSPTTLTKANLNEERFSALLASPIAPVLPGQDAHNDLSSSLSLRQQIETRIEAAYPEHDLETPRKDMEEMPCHPESENISDGVENTSTTAKKFGYTWKTSAGSEVTRQSSQRSRNDHAREVLQIIHSRSKGDLSAATKIADTVQRRLSSVSGDSTKKARDEAEDNDNNKDKDILISNIKSFISSTQFKTKGRRRELEQHSLIAVATSLLSPENGFYTVKCLGSSGKFPLLFERCPVLEESKIYETFKIVTPIGQFYCHKETLVGFYEQTERKLSHRSLNSDLKLNRSLLRNCQSHRNVMYCDERPFDQLLSKQMQRWDNFDDEIRDAVYLMGHDPEYVRPDNYCSQRYRCLDSDGSRCKHYGRRHNWMINANMRSQYEIFLDSMHFQHLVSNLQALNSTKGITKDFVQQKVSYRKFKKCIPNCVKSETRASCVDPIEAPAYDFARCLQLYFKGLKSKQTKMRMRYQSNQHNFYDPGAESDEEEINAESDEDINTESGEEGISRENEEDISSDGSDEEGIPERGARVAPKTLYEKLEECPCRHCQNKKGWLSIFDQIKDETPHKSLLRYCLCTPSEHPDLTLKNSKHNFTLYNWKCFMQDCSICGVENLPFDCPVVQNCTEKISVWVWTKTTGDNERTGKKQMLISEAFEGLRSSLKDFAKHTGPLQMWNQGRRIAVAYLLNQEFKMVCMTDFSSQMDLVPVRKVNCHVNKHASLGIFVLLFQETATVDGEEIKYIACHEWYVFGSCEEKGKQNDWIFHNKAQDFIQSYALYSTIKTWEWFTDNCPGQYKCRQNLYQVAKKTTTHNHLEAFSHNFAKQHGFKNKSDTIGHWMKCGIKKIENDFDVHASSALYCAQLALTYAEEKKTELEQLLENNKKTLLNNEEKLKLKKMLRTKSPYDCTRRHVAYIEDTKEKYDKYKDKLPDMNIFFSDRARMKDDEDIDAIKDTTKFYSFSHQRADDNPNENSIEQIPVTGDKEHTCRWCHKMFKNGGKTFKDHEELCTELACTGKSHKIRYKFFKCLCWKCQAGEYDQCNYREFSGEQKYKFVASKKDIEQTKIVLTQRKKAEERKKVLELCQEVLSTLSDPPYPPLLGETKGLKMKHWKAIKDLLNISATSENGGSGKTMPKKDIISALQNLGDWTVIIPLLKETLSKNNL